MTAKGQAGAILLIIFILGIVVEVYYIYSFIIYQSSLEDILEKTLTTGILTAMLIVLAILLIKQNIISEQLKSLSPNRGTRTSGQVRKELDKLYRDLGALKIVSMDNLIEEKEYMKKKAGIDKLVQEKKAEFRTLERMEKKV
jgi:hypothetical protein